jgi:hypothetical protein
MSEARAGGVGHPKPAARARGHRQPRRLPVGLEQILSQVEEPGQVVEILAQQAGDL